VYADDLMMEDRENIVKWKPGAEVKDLI